MAKEIKIIKDLGLEMEFEVQSINLDLEHNYQVVVGLYDYKTAQRIADALNVIFAL